MEKRNYNKKCITKLIDEHENEITEPEEILKYEENLYKQLYTLNKKNKLNDENYFKDDTLPKISEDERESCEIPVTLTEIGKALKDLHKMANPLVLMASVQSFISFSGQQLKTVSWKV